MVVVELVAPVLLSRRYARTSTVEPTLEGSPPIVGLTATGLGPWVDSVRAVDRRLTRRANRRRLLFNARTPMNYAIVAPLHRAMRSDPRVEFYFTASETPQRAAEILRDAGPEARIIKPQRAALIRFDAYVVADRLWMTLPRGAPRVQMFHGVGGKFAHDYDKPTSSMRQWDRLFFVNERRLRNFLQAGAIDADSKAPRLVGMPRVDCLVDGSWNRDEILVRLGLDPGRPTILYAPTWSAASSINRLGEELIRRLLDGPWNVIVKLHDRLRDPREFYSGGLDWGVKLQPMLARANGHLASGADINPYLVAADVMITDHSSAGFEYLLLDRPLVRIDVPDLITSTNANPDYVDLLRSAATSATDTRGVISAVEISLADPARLSPARTAVAADLFYRPGTATRRAMKELYDLMELEPPDVGHRRHA
jgi:CDP-glycerol glycerophosphotransferase (TagB/SpsB family)